MKITSTLCTLCAGMLIAVLGSLNATQGQVSLTQSSVDNANVFGDLRDQPQGFLPPIAPIMDIPMRDPHAMLGPDGNYYLVGTQPPDDDPTHNFWNPYNGIRVYCSSDLVHWDNLGYVYTLRDNGTWQLTYNPGSLLPSFVKDREHPKPTIWAPDIYYINGNWWIAYALAYNGWGSVNGLLKSTTGKVTGPYAEVNSDGPITTLIDSGLFQSDDGRVFYVWCDGRLALMNSSMTKLDEQPFIVTPSNSDRVAFEGCALREINGRFYMQAAGDGGYPRNYHGFSTYDMYVASSDNIYGPYGPNYIGIREGGHNVMFRGKNNRWYATFFGWNPVNPFNEKPGILPIELDQFAHVAPYYDRYTILSPDARVGAVNWAYTFTNPGQNWAELNFAATDWQLAEGGFGKNAVSAQAVPTRTLWSSPDIWMRRHFMLPKSSPSSYEIGLDIFHQGPAEVYINGVLTYTSTENQQYYREDYPLSADAVKSLIVGGDNVIAIHSTCGPERYIDAGLRLFTHTELVPIGSIKPTGSGPGPYVIDLGRMFDITRTDLTFADPKVWHHYKIEYSSDNANWDTYYAGNRPVNGDPCYTDVFDNGISADHVRCRFVRVTAADSQTVSGGSRITEFDVYGHLPVVDGDLAAGRPVTASSSDVRYPPQNAVDGYWGTIWRPGAGGPQWLDVDLGSVQTIHATKTWFRSPGSTYQYKIATSNDNVLWSPFADRSANGEPADPYYTDYHAAQARYVRLIVLGDNDNIPIDLSDFKVFGESMAIPAPEPALADGLMGHWKFDESTGATAFDASNAHNDATVTGPAIWTPDGRMNGAIHLNGSAIKIANGPPGAFTCSFWVKTTDSGPIDATGNSVPLIGSSSGAWVVGLTGTTISYTEGSNRVSAIDPVNDGVWHACAITRSVSGIVEISIDGNPQVTVKLPETADLAGGGVIVGGSAFNGDIDDLYLYNRVLDDIDIASLQTQPPKIVGQWTFSEGTGSKSANISGQANDANFFNGPTWSPSGFGGGSVVFGSDQSYAEIARPIKNDFTISFWVKTTQSVPDAQWFQGAWLLSGEMPGDTNDFGTSLSGGHFVFGTGEPDTTLASKSVINDGNWHHCVATRHQATGTLNIYVDGKFDGTVHAGTSTLTAPSVLRLSDTGDNHFIGTISDLRIYDGALSADDIAKLYSNELTKIK